MKPISLLLCLAINLVFIQAAAAQDEKDPFHKGKKLSAWLEDLQKGPTDRVRGVAAHALLEIGPATKDVVPALVQALDDKSPGVRYDAMYVLKEMDLPPKDAVPACLKGMESKDEIVRTMAITALGYVGGESDEGFQVILKAALGDHSVKVRIAAAGALKDMNMSSEQAVLFFEKAMARNEFHDAAIAAIARHGAAAKAAVPALRKAMKDTGVFYQNRVKIIAALGEMGPAAKDAVPDLIALARDRDYKLRETAVTALSKLGPDGKQAIPELIRSLKDQGNLGHANMLRMLTTIDATDAKVIEAAASVLGHNDTNVRDAAVFVLKASGKAAVPVLAESYKKGDNRHPIAEIFGAIGPPAKDAVPVMCDALPKEGLLVKMKSAWALGKMGADAKDAVPALTKLLSDDANDVRNEAALALAAIGPTADSLPALMEAFKEKPAVIVDTRLQANVILAIGATGPAGRDAVPFLIKVMTERQPKGGGKVDPNLALIRANAVDALAKIGAPAIPALLEVLRDKNLFGQDQAAKALGAMGPLAIPALTDALKDDNRYTRAYAATAFSYIGPKAKKAVPALIETVDDKDTLVSSRAIVALDVIGRDKAAIPAFIRALERDGSNAQPAAAKALGHFGADAKDAVPTLVKLLENGKGDQRALIAALTDIGAPAKGALPALHNLLENARDGNLRKLTSAAIVKIGPTKESLPILTKTLKDANTEIRADAALAIGMIGAPAKDMIPSLASALRDFGPVRTNAMKSLQKFGPDAKDTIPALIELITSPPVGVTQQERELAAATLAKIGPDAIPALTKLCESIRPGAPVDLVGAAFAQMGKDGLPAVRDGLKSKNYHHRASSAVALTHMNPPPKEMLPDLTELLKDMMMPVRTKAIVAVGKYGPDAKDAVPALRKILRQKELDAATRSAIVTTLGNMGPAAADAIPTLNRVRTSKLSDNERSALDAAIKKIRAKVEE